MYPLYASGYTYTGTNVGDAFAARHSGMPFTTFDNDNDNYDYLNCAVDRQGAYWYDSCADSNLNGLNLGAGSDHTLWTGIFWYPWTSSKESAKSVYMAIK